MDVNRKYVAMVRDGITPRRIEQCRTSDQLTTLAETHGWDVSDVKQFAKSVITRGRPTKAIAA